MKKFFQPIFLILILGSLTAVISCQGASDDDAADDAAADDTGDDTSDMADDTGDDTGDDTSDDTSDDTADDTGSDDDGDAPNNCDGLVDPILEEPEWIFVSAGTFQLGSPDDEPGREAIETQHEVTLTRDFYMMKYEVMQSLWQGAMGDLPGGQWGCGNTFPTGDASWLQSAELANALSEAFGYEPCYTIDFENDTAEWDQECDGFRLPTEAEWEFAARAGAQTAFYNGQITDGACGDPLLGEIAWYCGNSGYEIHDTGQKTPNDLGLYDMLGDIWEWAWDGADNDEQIPYLADPATDPLGPGGTIAHAYRGGGMFSTAIDCRLAKRRFARTNMQDGDTGARFVRTAFAD